MIPSKELALLWAFPLGIITPIRRLPLGPLSWLTCYLGLFLNVSIKPETISVTPRLPPYLRESHLPPSAADSLRNSSARAAQGALCICANSPGAEQQLPPLLSPTQGTRTLHVAGGRLPKGTQHLDGGPDSTLLPASTESCDRS